MPKRIKCLMTEKKKIKKQALKLEYLYSAFVFLGLGVFVSICVFISEILVFKTRERYQKNKFNGVKSWRKKENRVAMR